MFRTSCTLLSITDSQYLCKCAADELDMFNGKKKQQKKITFSKTVGNNWKVHNTNKYFWITTMMHAEATAQHAFPS